MTSDRVISIQIFTRFNLSISLDILRHPWTPLTLCEIHVLNCLNPGNVKNVKKNQRVFSKQNLVTQNMLKVCKMSNVNTMNSNLANSAPIVSGCDTRDIFNIPRARNLPFEQVALPSIGILTLPVFQHILSITHHVKITKTSQRVGCNLIGECSPCRPAWPPHPLNHTFQYVLLFFCHFAFLFSNVFGPHQCYNSLPEQTFFFAQELIGVKWCHLKKACSCRIVHTLLIFP